MNDLHNAILNIPADYPDWMSPSEAAAYRRGHKDARHAAAEMVAGEAATHEQTFAEIVLYLDAAFGLAFRPEHARAIKGILIEAAASPQPAGWDRGLSHDMSTFLCHLCRFGTTDIRKAQEHAMHHLNMAPPESREP